MKKLFQIDSTGYDIKVPVLCLRAGTNFFSFAVIDAGRDELKKLFYYSVDQIDTMKPEELLQLHPFLNNSFSRVLLCYDDDESMLLPADLPVEGNHEKIMTTLFGFHVQDKPVIDSLDGFTFSCCSRLPVGFYSWVTSTFDNVIVKGREIALLSSLTMHGGHHVFINFRNDFYDTLLLVDSKVQLSRTSRFSCPEDVLFRILKCCELLGMDQSKVQLHISGLIEKQSSLYKYLYDYFVHINFREATWKDDTGSYPPHFFTAINDLYLCES